MDDMFDSVLTLEQDFIAEGAKEGRREGMKLGLEEGRQLGLQKGFEIGIEVGEYAGFVSGLRQLQQQAPGSLPPRLDRNLAAMEECLTQFPLYDPLDESIQDLLEALRGKHKATTAALTKQQQPDAASSPAGKQQQQQQQQQQHTQDSLAF